MKSEFSEDITIVFSNECSIEFNSQKLASEIALEYLNIKCKTRCIPLSSFLEFKTESTNKNLNKLTNVSKKVHEPKNIVKNGCCSSHKNELKTLMFIFENRKGNSDVIKLENTLNDWLCDFRVDKGDFMNSQVVFVIQDDSAEDSIYSDQFITNLRNLFTDLGFKLLVDDNFYIKNGDIGQILSMIDYIAEKKESYLESLKNGEPPNSNHDNHKEDSEDVESEEEQEDDSEGDIENLGEANRQMTTPTQRKRLIKQGYRLIGEHSAVKLCRWTKSRVRCYKHTFYGINSNQCMEMTPSLACANKCVFCWRHHTNPVGTKWKWDTDNAEFIVSESINAHLKLIKELRGIFDTKMERFNEALKIRHCALSLVGEPIMYPQINELIGELHKNEISTFLVTNAQFPKEVESLVPVTQLYVSIDAPDKVSLKNIDRPLFRDFWERFLRCIEILKDRRERTVFRLTLVRNFNMTEQKSEIEGYANLMRLGEPDFVEIKAVTFCGTVHDNAITMKNVPWHDEVVEYSKALINIDDYVRDYYDLVCEHRHSCCVLIAKKSYCVNGKWNTWIDYPMFNKLVASGRDFTGLDYSCQTPEWALFGSPEEGFDPEDTRIYTKGRHKLNK
ncbi:tRNA wybutosine-synthesizing protein 1-like protein [Theileria orientalis]|uniref:tRNA wybutosine-synthesizing protein 1-like protein n=1 Tax=Theileria orientalis TaxID=68886 RepID=A0A976QRF0_THEOR|nr:tRNA wybutosine-synthesizing protein 1-like protein [Theileria orientalis]